MLPGRAPPTSSEPSAQSRSAAAVGAGLPLSRPAAGASPSSETTGGSHPRGATRARAPAPRSASSRAIAPAPRSASRMMPARGHDSWSAPPGLLRLAPVRPPPARRPGWHHPSGNNKSNGRSPTSTLAEMPDPPSSTTTATAISI